MTREELKKIQTYSPEYQEGDLVDFLLSKFSGPGRQLAYYPDPHAIAAHMPEYVSRSVDGERYIMTKGTITGQITSSTTTISYGRCVTDYNVAFHFENDPHGSYWEIQWVDERELLKPSRSSNVNAFIPDKRVIAEVKQYAYDNGGNIPSAIITITKYEDGSEERSNL